MHHMSKFPFSVFCAMAHLWVLLEEMYSTDILSPPFEFYAKLNLFPAFLPSYYNYVCCSHQYNPLATCSPFYFVKFGPGDVEQCSFKIWDHLLNFCHIMSRPFGGRGNARLVPNSSRLIWNVTLLTKLLSLAVTTRHTSLKFGTYDKLCLKSIIYFL